MKNGDLSSTSRGKEKDLKISVESTAEWQIHDIGFDGQERYLQPLVFSDHVAKLAHKVNWREVTGDSTIRDDPNIFDDDSNEPIAKQQKLDKVDKEPERPEGVGPWQNVAKNLHQSLTQINVLLDVLKVAQNEKYLVLHPVFESTAELEPVEPKGVVRAAKRKALSNISEVLTQLTQRVHSAKSTGTDSFLNELLQLREKWRVKKVGNTILGDVGYHIYGTKFQPNATFEVRRRTEPTANGSCLEVKIPKDLERTASLKISIEKDDSGDLFGDSSQSLISLAADSSSNFDGTWQQKLDSAQQTLLAKDLFSQLAKDAVQLSSNFAVVKDDVIIISLNQQGFLLKIQLVYDQKSAPFFVLGHNLHRMFREDLKTKSFNFQQMAALPLTPGPRKRKAAGPAQQTADELKQKVKPSLLVRLMSNASHLVIVKRVQSVLHTFCKQCTDPIVTWRWWRTGHKWSVVKVQINNPHPDTFGRTQLQLNIDCDGVTVISRDGVLVNLGQNGQLLLDTLWIQVGRHFMTTCQSLFKGSRWQVLHSNTHSLSDNNHMTPTLSASHQTGNMELFIKFPLRKDPEITIYKCSYDQSVRKREKIDIKYDNLIGNCVLHRLELLLASLSN